MSTIDAASLLLRVVVGVTMVAHGWNHLFGPGGVSGTARWFDSMGLRPARLHAKLSGFGELSSGLALAAGILTPLAAAFVVGTMTVAGVIAHRHNGFFVFKDGYEYVVVLGATALSIATLGPGNASLDYLLRLDTALDGLVGASVAAAGAIGAAILLTLCWRPAGAHRTDGA